MSTTLRAPITLAVLTSVAALAASTGTNAAGRAIEDVRFVKQNGVARAEIVFGCPVRYLSHTPESGVDVQVRIALEPECVAALGGGGLRSELFDPPAGNLAGVKQVVFDTTVENSVARVAVNVGRIVRFTVSQGPMRNVVRIELAEGAAATDVGERLPTLGPSAPRAPESRPPPSVTPEPRPGVTPGPRPSGAPPANEAPSGSGRVAVAAAPEPATPGAVATPESASGSPAPVEPAAPAAPLPDRRPLRLVQPAEARAERFALQLAAGPDAAAEADAPALAAAANEVLYVNERRAGTREWQELRLGFFNSENDARARLALLARAFPSAVIAIATVDEQDAAAGARRLQPRASAVSESAAPERSSEPRSLPALTPERLDALVAEGNEAMLAQNYDRGVQIYTRLLEEPGYAGQREARERLGIARERNGQLAQARREYEAYLAEFPDGADAGRVRQRLAGLVTAAAPSAAARERVEQVAADALWDYDGGVAQYYRRDVYRPLEDLPVETLQSALLSHVNLVVRRHGERFELATRIDAQYRYNLIDEDDPHAAWRDPDDQLYLTNAYVNVVDQQRDWSARLGRQSLHESGVLGRFDGARAEYRWKPRIGLNLTLGRPVEYPRHAVDSHRQFVAFSADMDELVKQWDMSFFGLMQEVDGVADRQAVGAEARYLGTEWSVVSSVDYDMSYGVLNSALVSANWRATERLTLNGRLNVGVAPFLATRNALIGQSVTSIDELLGSFSERQIRRIARNRTAQGHDGALGLSLPLFDRYQLNVDVMFSEFDATVASAGVMALPPSGAQTFVQATLVGSSVLKSGDTAIFSLRHGSHRNATTDTFVFDVRLPAAQKLRWNPRIALTSRTNLADGSDQWIAAPMLRLAMRWPNHHRFELELGGQWSDKELPAPDPMFGELTEETSAYFVNAGYWWEF
jgi:hypothetical protein